ncbi:hypothetical protein GCM10011511_57520 [Puia dinghuensis]|uniref:Macroglobulin domain-containing protein n=1 Tax=Puia dinghuensis TaxID=1792502 RepID=A0A8J2XY29_9BACT|nr:hypothetical protein GCM10011511_57520 [Puia dinghuensis]
MLAQPEKDSLQASFIRYQSQAPREKLFVHVDKTFYLAGETLWFKIYAVDASSDIPDSLSAVSYVELIDRDQKAVLQEKVQLRNGKGDGYFRIAPSIRSGHYIFRAYTNWMKNFSPDGYYQQNVTILNTLSENTVSEPPIPDSPHHVAGNIQFFPEGGNLVNGLTSIVAFKAVNPTGKGIPCHGVVVNQHQDTVASFHSNRFGMGTFPLTPVKGNTYYAHVETPSSTLTEKLPTAYDQGYVMHLDQPIGNNLDITVTTSSVPSAPANSVAYLFVHTRGRVKFIRVNQLKNNATSFQVNIDSLDDGISHFTILNSERLPVCERLWCKPPRQQVHIAVNITGRDTGNILPATPSFTYGPREKLTVHLTTTDPSGHPVPANLSLSVFLHDSLQPIPGENILNYLLLTSDLKGKIDSPDYYFASVNPATTEALDDLMLTQGWTRFRWEDILQNKKPYFEFRPETNALVISAKMMDKHTNLPPPPAIGYLSIPGKPFIFSSALSNPDGTLYFNVGNFYGNKEIIAQTNSLTDSNYRIDIANPFSDRPSWQPPADSLFPSRARSQLLDRSISVQVENAYRAAEKHHLLPLPPGDTTGFYGHADLSYSLDDYTRFVTMDEVIREFVNDVRVRRNSGRAYFRVMNSLFNIFFDDDPLLLIDGFPVFDGDKMIGVNPLKIEKIDVVPHRYFFGPSISDGIVSFLSYDGDLGGYHLDPSALVIQYNGLQQHQEFYSPVYEPGVRSTIPDLRNQLLWSPEIETDSAGKKQLLLYTSDLKGKFALVVQGMTPEGLVGYSISTISVGHP